MNDVAVISRARRDGGAAGRHVVIVGGGFGGLNAARALEGSPGDNVRRLARGEPTRPFLYRDRGVMATVGRNVVVAEVGVDGLLGWSITGPAAPDLEDVTAEDAAPVRRAADAAGWPRNA
jgi:NADH dehydrogenase FAD-containing subunit